MAYEMSELKKIGLGLIGFGIFFTFLGALLFFDRGLLALGNIFWLSGVAILLGWNTTWKLFTNRANYKGTICFLLGLFFIFVRWPVVGIIFEIYGCIALFGGFWPSVKVFLYQIPVFGWIIQYPITVSSFDALYLQQLCFSIVAISRGNQRMSSFKRLPNSNSSLHEREPFGQVPKVFQRLDLSYGFGFWPRLASDILSSYEDNPRCSFAHY
ncbi:hypothetical protein SADUNF_Sadunf14G0115200 [Salix dunnii]|uniref:Vesicle transport protein GOT1 n=1 Tax=Salix dunnii TaxID=1413687 RepID=A0A835JHP0_9ROSI|nr:hypothetical protein SADUNF_Sadunf14G0115200 [Salix dunnii]